jgi:hypothetical protein
LTPTTKNLSGVERLARTDEVVPPADVLRIVGIDAGDVVTTGKGMADQHGVGARRVERAVGFENQFETGQAAPLFSGSGSSKRTRCGATIPTELF